MDDSDSIPPYVRPPERPGMKQWECKTCFFRVEAEALPFRCPRCGASRVKMETVAAKPSTPDSSG